MEEFDLPDGREVRITERALANVEDHDDCPFCQGRAAAHRGDGEDCNPSPRLTSLKVRQTATKTTTGYRRWVRGRFGGARRAAVV